MVNTIINGVKILGKTVVVLAASAVGLEVCFKGGQMIMDDAMVLADIKPEVKVVSRKGWGPWRKVTVKTTDPLSGISTYTTYKA